jgi:GT2 family glycosyltransferase
LGYLPFGLCFCRLVLASGFRRGGGMNICAVVVGFNHWWGETENDKTFTHKFIRELVDKNPTLKVVLIDNFSQRPYPDNYCEVIRTPKRIGYAPALNLGIKRIEKDNPDWIITLNNDIEMTGRGDVVSVVERLKPDVLYGSGVNRDDKLKIDFQWSAWLCISRKVFEVVGYFDEQLSAAFEDFDYELRAMSAGFKLDFAKLPMEHLDKHTRYENKHYPRAWEDARLYFQKKHGLELAPWFKPHEIENGFR